MSAPHRAEARRPRVVLFDVYETLLRLDGLRDRFVEIGRPEHELELFFARTVRDGMALTLAGRARPFAEVARAALLTTAGHKIGEEAIQHVLSGFRVLPPHPDAEPAFAALATARVPIYAFTQGSADSARAALERAGLHTYLRGVFSCEEIGSFKPPARVYHWACDQVDSVPRSTALVAAHSWDVHGAVRAGLVGGFVTRLEGAVPDVVDPPHVVADRLDVLAEKLLALPA